MASTNTQPIEVDPLGDLTLVTCKSPTASTKGGRQGSNDESADPLVIVSDYDKRSLQSCTRFKVSSKALCLGSKVVATMLQNTSFKEGRAMAEGNLRELILYDDNPNLTVWLAILRVLHHQGQHVSSSLGVDDLIDVVILGDKYDMREALKGWDTKWLGRCYPSRFDGNLRYSDKIPMDDWLKWFGLSCWFQDSDSFAHLSEWILRNSYIPRGSAQMTLQASSPLFVLSAPFVSESIMKDLISKRIQIEAGITQIIRGAMKIYTNCSSSIFVCKLGAMRDLQATNALRRNCDMIQLGSLCRHLESFGWYDCLDFADGKTPSALAGALGLIPNDTPNVVYTSSDRDDYIMSHSNLVQCSPVPELIRKLKQEIEDIRGLDGSRYWSEGQ